MITDHFTRYAHAFPTRTQEAKTTAKVLFDNSIVHYGFPAGLHIDQGRHFGNVTIHVSLTGENVTDVFFMHIAMGRIDSVIDFGI